MIRRRNDLANYRDNKLELGFQKSAEELPVLRRVPDVQDFNGVVFHAVGDDVWQPPVQQFTGAFLVFSLR